MAVWLCGRNQREALSSERQQLEMNNQELHSLMEALHDSVTARQRHDNKAQLTQAVTDVLERHERHRNVMVKKGDAKDGSDDSASDVTKVSQEKPLIVLARSRVCQIGLCSR